MTFVTVTRGLLTWLGAVWLWSQSLSKKTTAVDDLDCRRIGVWEGNWVAFFDNSIIDADAPGYVRSNLSWEAISNRAASEKKTKYRHAAEDLRGSITPLVCSTDGVVHREYAAFQKRFAERLAMKWEKPLPHVLNWVCG